MKVFEYLLTKVVLLWAMDSLLQSVLPFLIIAKELSV